MSQVLARLPRRPEIEQAAAKRRLRYAERLRAAANHLRVGFVGQRSPVRDFAAGTAVSTTEDCMRLDDIGGASRVGGSPLACVGRAIRSDRTKAGGAAACASSCQCHLIVTGAASDVIARSREGNVASPARSRRSHAGDGIRLIIPLCPSGLRHRGRARRVGRRLLLRGPDGCVPGAGRMSSPPKPPVRGDLTKR